MSKEEREIERADKAARKAELDQEMKKLLG